MTHLEELKKETKKITTLAKIYYVNHGYITPVVFFKTSTGEKLVIPLDCNDTASKNNSFEEASNIMRENKCEWYIFCAETYITKNNLPKKEAILVIASDKWGNTLSYIIEIRNKTIIDEQEMNSDIKILMSPFKNVFPMTPTEEVDNLFKDLNIK